MPVSPLVKKLITINVAIWFLFVVVIQQFFLGSPLVFYFFGLTPQAVLENYFIWQFLTYAFIHSSGIFHILFNMFVLWMFGSELERFWGSKMFLFYYLFCAVGASLIYFIAIGAYGFFQGDFTMFQRPVIGASGAVFGLLLAYGWFFGDRMVYFMFLFPMKTRHFTILIAAIELVSILNHGIGGPVANLAHLGGLISGVIFLKFWKIFQKIQLQGWNFFKSYSRRLKVVEQDDRNHNWH